MARFIALIYNWWSIYIKLVDKKVAREAIKSRPLFLMHVGKVSTHQSTQTLVLFCAHAQMQQIKQRLEAAAEPFAHWAALTAEQLKQPSAQTNYSPYFSASPDRRRRNLQITSKNDRTNLIFCYKTSKKLT
jgi:hypothetical protein